MARVTALTLREKKQSAERITVLTAYDFPTAQLMEECGLDCILVGDSCGQAVMGRADTLSVTMEEMLHHVRMVSAAVHQPLVVADMPFMSYQVSPEQAVTNAGRFVAEAGAQSVKLEGSARGFGSAIERILNAGIPVMGHLGLTPQRIHQLGGYKVQGRSRDAREQLVRDARELQALGCFALVLEVVPADLAEEITAALDIPTIGIGAGPHCDGQVLVTHDMLGFGRRAKHAKVYADLRSAMGEALKEYVNEVKSGAFPGEEHSFS